MAHLTKAIQNAKRFKVSPRRLNVFDKDDYRANKAKYEMFKTAILATRLYAPSTADEAGYDYKAGTVVRIDGVIHGDDDREPMFYIDILGHVLLVFASDLHSFVL